MSPLWNLHSDLFKILPDALHVATLLIKRDRHWSLVRCWGFDAPTSFETQFSHISHFSKVQPRGLTLGNYISPNDFPSIQVKKPSLAKRTIKKPVKKPLPSIPVEEEEIPVPKGSYNLDFDNLDSMDPFKTKTGLSNSPTEKKPLSGYDVDFNNLDNFDPFKSTKAMSNSPPTSPVKNNLLVSYESSLILCMCLRPVGLPKPP